MKLSDTAMCYICKNAVETISHLYWDCERNKRLWERLKELLFQALGFNLTLNPKICLLQLMDDTNKPLPPFIRQILLLCKQYIHNCKCRATVPDFIGFKHSLNWVIRLEKIINLNKANTGETLHNWNKLSDYL